MLVISSNVPEDPRSRSEIKAEIEEKVELPCYHSSELHLTRPEEAEYYLRASS